MFNAEERGNQLTMAHATQFQGGVLAATLEGGRAPAYIEVHPDALQARTDQGVLFDLPFSEIEIELGGSAKRTLFCRNKTRTLSIFCEERGFIFALTSIAGHHIQEKMAPVTSQVKRQRLVRSFAGLAIAALVAGLGVGVPKLIRWGIRSAVAGVPYTLDEQLGRKTLATMNLNGPVIDPVITDALDTLLSELVAHLPKNQVRFKVHVIASPEVNAFALPGGDLVIYSGLLLRATRSEHISGVLAHEMTHIIERHGLQRIAQSLGIIATVQFWFGDVTGALALGKELLTTAGINSYSRRDEAQADAGAVAILHAAGLDAAALAAFLEIIQQDEQRHIAPWIQNHPALDERIVAIMKQTRRAALTALRAPAVDWSRVRQHLEANTAPLRR